MAKKVIPPTELERHVNHSNFRRLEEKPDQFIIFMNSVKMKGPKQSRGEGVFTQEIVYFNIDKTAKVSNHTYSIIIKK